MKIDGEEVWNKFIKGNQGENIKGGDSPDELIGGYVNVMVPHKNEELELLFGTTSDRDPC